MKYLGCLLCLLLISCLRIEYLANGYTKVPRKPKAYKKRKKFHDTLLSMIDTSVVYEEIDKSGMLKRNSERSGEEVYGCYRFYSNGNVNLFVIPRDKLLVKDFFDPKFNGMRGVYFLDNDKIKMEIFASVNGVGSLGKVKKEIRIKNDTLFVENLYPRYVKIFVKRNLPKDFMGFDSVW